jgi:glycosyltransferase involved in cell wall biosynthesis
VRDSNLPQPLTFEKVARGRVLMLIENLSVPFDSRVWQESRTLATAGYEVTVVSPQGREIDAAPYERIDGIDVHRFPLRQATGTIGFAGEYAAAYRRMQRLVTSLAASQRFDVVHAGNPPDFQLLLARKLKRDGTRFVFDVHDLVPELYRSRFGRTDPLYRGFCLLERAAFRLADVVITTNESYRRITIERGGKAPEDVFVVRNASAPGRFELRDADQALKNGKRFLLAYLGFMGPQDGVDTALRALAHLRAERDDWMAIFMGSGESYDGLRRLADDLGLAGTVTFTGHVGNDVISRVLSTADVGLSPEPPSPLNDISTFVKVVEYMWFGRPIVAFDLAETRFSAGDAASYAVPPTDEAFACAIAKVLDDPHARAAMGTSGRARFEQSLSWDGSERQLLRAYERLSEVHRPPPHRGRRGLLFRGPPPGRRASERGMRSARR